MRILYKTIIYRIMAVISTILVALVLGVNIELATVFGIITEVIHTVIYYLFERHCEKK